jgi:hypothetical protein
MSRYQPIDVADIALIAPAAAAAAGCLLRSRGVLLKLCSLQLCKEDTCWTAERHICTAAVARSASGVIFLSETGFSRFFSLGCQYPIVPTPHFSRL